MTRQHADGNEEKSEKGDYRHVTWGLAVRVSSRGSKRNEEELIDVLVES